MDLTQQEWALQLAQDPDAVLLDVRTPQEWADGIIPGALQIDIYTGQAFVYKVDELDREKSYYIYCKAGGRSAQACSLMKQMGFTKTYNLLGGFMNWEGETSI
ncbi:MAG: rhodanese [Flavobacterium sp. BFFFF2]|nr:MAG: rhodanese [Flavobacterium sp. BFFFF2]